MEVIATREPHPGTAPAFRGPPVEIPAELETAIRRSQSYLLSQQKPQGYWVGELMVDATLVSDTIAYHHWNGKVDKEWQRKGVNHILSMQLPDGGWSIYHGGPPEVNATIKAYLALKLAGVPVLPMPLLLLWALGISVGLALLASFFPARRAAKLDPCATFQEI